MWNRFMTWLFRREMRVRSLLGLDCSGCIQREINRVGAFPDTPVGTYRTYKTLRIRG